MYKFCGNDMGVGLPGMEKIKREICIIYIMDALHQWQ